MEGPIIDVSTWKDTSPPVLLVAARPRRLISPTLIGVCGTILLHILVIRTAQIVSGGVALHSQVPSLAKNSDAGVDAPDLMLITVQPSPSSSSNQIVVSVTAAITNLKPNPASNPDLPLTLDVDSLSLGDEVPAVPDNGDHSQSDRDRFIGIYTGQIHARVDRVWRRPRAPIDEGSVPQGEPIQLAFQCEAQIVQDSTGNVQEILLPNCNGSSAWRQSLIAAIRHSSPLPAPPDASVFSRSVTLRFVGLPYTPGEHEDDYESESRDLDRSN